MKKTYKGMKNTNTAPIFIAVLIAIFSPIFIMPLIYPAFQAFLPEGNIVLTPPLRITATCIMSVIDYGLSYIAIYHTPFRKKLWFIFLTYILTLLWCIAMGVLWYISI